MATSILDAIPDCFSLTFMGLEEASHRPLEEAFSPATARPSVRASSRSNPSRCATTAAHRVRIGARLMEMVFAATELPFLLEPWLEREQPNSTPATVRRISRSGRPDWR
jgi:hypothetical protein